MNRKTVMQTGWHWVLALLMLLTQQAALRHSLHHDAHDEGPVAHSQCLSCLAGHALDHATSGTPAVSLPGCDATSAQVASTAPNAPAAMAVAHRARGPPAFLA